MKIAVDIVDTDPGQIAEAIDWAREKGARVINCSFSLWDDPDMKNAVDRASTGGCVLVGAAGNERV